MNPSTVAHSKLWVQYWESHPRLNFWHAQTAMRRDNASECCPQPMASTVGKTAFVVTGGDAEPDVVGLLSFLSHREVIWNIAYQRRTRQCFVQFCDETAAASRRKDLIAREVECSELQPGRPLRGSELLLKGPLAEILLKEQQPTLFVDLFTIFGSCDLTMGTCDDGSPKYLRITFNDSNAQIARAEAAFCLWQLQAPLARDWSLLLFMPSDAQVAPTPKTASVEPAGRAGGTQPRTLPPSYVQHHHVHQSGHTAVVPGPVAPRPRCPNDGNCPTINDLSHQAQYLHVCTASKPCAWLSHPQHTQNFIH